MGEVQVEAMSILVLGGGVMGIIMRHTGYHARLHVRKLAVSCLRLQQVLAEAEPLCFGEEQLYIDGLLLWLDAQNGVELEPGSDHQVMSWSNTRLAQLPWVRSRLGLRPELGSGETGPYVEFGYHKTGSICMPDGSGLPDGVRTVISVHSFLHDPTVPCQFYIITGDDQGPFHATEDVICSGHGSWAGGEAFCNGTIRLDGQSGVPVRETSIQEFDGRARVAVVECAAVGCTNKQGNGMNRIGRDRDCHAFTGRVHELLVYDCALASSDVIDIEEYLMRKWQ